jgi:hypothetical protein
MKRNFLVAFLVTAACAAASLAGTPAAAVDIECRYLIEPGPGLEPVLPLPPPPPGPVPNQVVYVSGVTSASPYRALFEVRQPYWSVVGVRSAAGTDYNLRLRDCLRDRIAVSTLSGVRVDFVAVDGNQPTVMPGRIAATVSNATDQVGTFALEYSTGGPAPAPGATETLLLRGTPALVRDVYVPPGGTAIIGLRLVSGAADLAVVASTSETRLASRAEAIQTSTQPGLDEDRVVITVPRGSAGQTFGVVVVNNVANTQAVLYRI